MSDRESETRMGTSQRAASSITESERVPQPEGEPEAATITEADKSEAGKRPQA